MDEQAIPVMQPIVGQRNNKKKAEGCVLFSAALPGDRDQTRNYCKKSRIKKPSLHDHNLVIGYF